MAEAVTQPKGILKEPSIPGNKPNFDPTMHQPPRINQFGFNVAPKMKLGDDGSNILKQKDDIKVPEWWSTTSPNKMTRTQLLEDRKKSRIPDISYDLDGDGYVGGRDYVISKIFDKDGDGKLNT